MKNECKKCNVVHSSLADKCFSCGSSFKRLNVSLSGYGVPTLVATTFVSLSVVIMNVNLIFGS